MRRIALLLAALAVAAGAGAWWMYARVQEPFRGAAEAETFVDIPSGTGPAGIGARLVNAGLVRDAWTFRAAVLLSGRARELKAGEYRFDAPMTALDVVGKIARGEVYTRLLTFREGLTMVEMAAVFEERGFGAAADFTRAAQDASLIRDLDPAARDLEGYLFPETYALPRRTPAADVVAQMVAGFKKAFDADLRAAAAAGGLTVRQAVTLASLVEKETASPDERPIVAAVYRNRMKIRMGMQADPTVIYALQKAGKYDGNLSKEDLRFDSPYNTYRYAGLPPGPIASAGRASLAAAVKPAAVDYLYFVSRNDGTHVFASTLAEHNRNVFTWQVDYFRKLRGRSR
ncbi:MAG: endolytic transglycosylase MltG [Vicinamibacterales bacterium]|jgi:UPF0755 protein